MSVTASCGAVPSSAYKNAPSATNTCILPWLILPVLCAVFFFYGLTAGEFYRTESLRAIIGAEFLRSGDWIVPRLYGEPLFTKPPGMYAAIAAASWPLGHVTEWTARLPSAIAATVLVLLIFSLFSRCISRSAGLIAATVMPLSMMVLDKASAAEIDMLQVMWVAAAIVCAVRGLDESALAYRSRLNVARLNVARVNVWWIAALLCVAGGFLTKWTAPAFFYCTLIPLLFWRGRIRMLWSLLHIVGLALASTVCLAWAGIAIGMEGWDVFAATVERQAFTHLLPTHHHRPYPWLESLSHPLRIWIAALPISVFALPALSPRFMALWDDRGRFLLQALHCWTWPNLLFWSLVPAHNARHSFPLYPGIAGLAAMVWVAWYQGKLPWRLRRFSPGRALIALVGCWLLVKVIYVQHIVPERLRGRDPRVKGESLAARVPAGETLYLFRLKDEGIMFYYGRPTCRLPSIDHLPASDDPLYCILDERECRASDQRAEPLYHMHDEQGDPIVLVRVLNGKEANVDSEDSKRDATLRGRIRENTDY